MVKTIQTNVDAVTERDFECQSAMSEQFRVLTEFAERGGWSWDEIAMALLELTDDYATAMRMRSDADAQANFAPKSNTRH